MLTTNDGHLLVLSPDELILRRLLFAEHNCDGKYCDDGEMQCGACLIDFWRDSAAEIERKTQERNHRRMLAWHAGRQAGKTGIAIARAGGVE